MHDPVNHPAHYNQHPSGVECVTIAAGFDYCLGNCIKYIWRAGLKGDDPIEDLRKAAWYLNFKIKQLEVESERVQADRGGTGEHHPAGVRRCVQIALRQPAGTDADDLEAACHSEEGRDL